LILDDVLDLAVAGHRAALRLRRLLVVSSSPRGVARPARYARPMLSVVGLCLDIIGALALILGLFTHARIPTWGDVGQRTPEDIAHDVGFAIVGGVLLTLGFVFQSLTYLNVSVETTRACTLTAGLATLVGACLFAYVVYG